MPIKKRQFRSFENLLANATNPVLVNFYANWCDYCQRMFPVLQEVKLAYHQRLEIVTIDAEKYPDLAFQYEIKVFPTQIVFQNNQSLSRNEGELSTTQLINLLETLDSSDQYSEKEMKVPTMENILDMVFTLSREEQIVIATKILNKVIKLSNYFPEPDSARRIGNTQKVIDVTIKSLLGEEISFDMFTSEQISKVFELETNSNSLVNLVSSHKITIDNIVLDSRSSNVTNSSVSSSYEISIKIKNKTMEVVETFIPKGQIFENIRADMNRGFQNIVNAEYFPISLSPEEEAIFYLPGHCLNRNLQSPSGQNANVIPLKVSFGFTSQADVWDNVMQGLQL